jgi:predicted RNase H-like nuclease (RuvC/YqgF family)
VIGVSLIYLASVPIAVSARTSALDTLIFGIDIQSGDVRGDAPSYAVVAFDGEQIDREVVSFRKLRRLIDREKPGILATDNMYELAADKDALVHFLRELPSETKLVQVTGAERPEPLSRVASRHGVPYGKKPMKEAEAAARLAAGNVGHEVSAFTNTTRIKVSRGRSTGKGGWSADRYTRRIHGAVRKKSRDIESELDREGLDYEVDPTEKYGGYSNAIFLVDADPHEIPVSSGRAGDIRVEIERERTDGIEFEPLAKRRDYVLVGIDPGTTTAVAIVGIDGELLDVLSTRTADTAAVIEWIVERGRPFIVAADVTPMPNTVEKIRRSFDATEWIPESDLPVDEKQHRTREAGYDNDHERDAMAAALFAHDEYESQFERIAEKTPARIDRGEVTARVIGGESVEAVLDSYTEDEQEDEQTEEHTEPKRSPEQKRIATLETQVKRLKGHADDLRDTVEAKDERITGLEDDLSKRRSEERAKVRKTREITRLERESDRLEREREEAREERDALSEKLDRLKELWKLDHSNFADVEGEKRGLVSVKPIEKFTFDAIKRAKKSYGLAEDDVILLRDASGAGPKTANRLAEISPRVVLKYGGLSDRADEILFEEGIPVGPASEVSIQEVDELAVARETGIEGIIEGWHERAEDRRRDKNASMVDQVISEHRADSR